MRFEPVAGRFRPTTKISSPLQAPARLFAVLILLIASLTAPVAHAGCPRVETPEPLPRPAIPPGLEVDPPIDSREACPTWRWLAMKTGPGSGCPDPGGVGDLSWSVTPLFEPAADGFLPAVLAPYCLYEMPSGSAEARRDLNRRLERLVRRGLLEEVESSCAAAGPSAEEPESLEPGIGELTTAGLDPIWNRLQRFFLERTGALSSASWGPGTKSDPPTGEPKVRISLIDTQPDGNIEYRGNSEHGFALARIIQALTCPAVDAGCAARVVPRLGLPISEFSWENPRLTTFDLKRGGYFGTLDNLATSVWKDVAADLGRGDERPKMIINLSVGWVGERFGGLESDVDDMPLPVRSLYHALEVASCRDILVVASSGNRVGGPAIEEGALLPGAWQSRPAPTPERCRRLWAGAGDRNQYGYRGYQPYDEPDPLPEPYPSSPEPLVYAAGGVHAGDQTLVNARPSSEPALVAYADHAALSGLRTNNLPSLLTGSSIAAAVISAAAAAVWHHQPELSRRDLMVALYQSGQPLNRRADLYIGSTAPVVHRIAVCPALAAALGCTADAPSSCPFVCADSESDFPRLPARQFVTRRDGSNLSARQEISEFCGTDSVQIDSDRPSPTAPCPFRQFFGIKARPWTGPQPNNIPCLGCSVQPPPDDPNGGGFTAGSGNGWTLYIQIDPEWDGKTLKNATLLLGKESIFLDLDPLEAGDQVEVYGLKSTALQNSQASFAPTAVLQFETADGSVESPVVIEY